VGKWIRVRYKRFRVVSCPVLDLAPYIHPAHNLMDGESRIRPVRASESCIWMTELQLTFQCIGVGWARATERSYAQTCSAAY
jgi:hypothetical protein